MVVAIVPLAGSMPRLLVQMDFWMSPPDFGNAVVMVVAVLVLSLLEVLRLLEFEVPVPVSPALVVPRGTG